MFPVHSPFAEKLNTNYVPSDAEVQQIRALLMEPIDELARVDAQINELLAKRALLKAAIDAHRALTSPIRRIPQDVLLEIFFSCLPTAHNALIDPHEAPLLLGYICKHWRSVTYSTPGIWSSLHIPLLNHDAAPPSMILWLNAHVKAWLGRSATCPLSISFVTQSFYAPAINSAPSASPLEIVNLLFGVSRRIRSLDLSAGTSTLDPLLRLGPEDLPVLRSIRLHTFINRKLIEFPDATNVLQIPSLHDISLFVAADALSLPLRWSQLTKLCLECFPIWSALGVDGGTSAAGVLDVLRRCPNLVVCQINVTTDDGLAISSSPITLPNLEILTLGSRYLPARCIEFLVLPKLRWLKIGDVFFSDSSRSLSLPGSDLTVEIDTGGITLPNLISLLQQFPKISHLRLQSWSSHEGICLDDVFLARFYTPQDALCPMLTHFTVVLCATFSDATVLAFIRARRNMECSLQQIHIDFGRTVDVDIQPELQSFVSDGMTVDLKYFSSEWKFNAREGLFP